MKYSEKNKPMVCMMTQSTCYRQTKKMQVKGVLWHSTGANNPTLKRYVQPDDNAADRDLMINVIGKNAYGKDWNHTSVQAGLNAWIGKLADGSVAAVQTMPWDYLMKKIGNAYGVVGLMGNLYAESGLRANNLQNSYEKKLNITDVEYTRLVDENAYPDFVRDKAGYGLAQWTFWSRKEALLKFAKDKGKSIGDLQMQLDFLWKELNTGYQAVLIVLQNAENVREASDAVLLWYERPADQGEAVQKKRAGYGEGYLKKYGGSAEKPASVGMTNADCPFLVRVAVKDLRIRKGAGTDTEWTGKYVPVGTYTIVEVKAGKGSDAGWGRLKSGAGWIALSYAKRVNMV